MNVAIIGAGLAGLTCAFSLKQRGISATVFEAESAAGGRCSGGPYLLDRNAYANTFRLADALGLSQEIIEIPPVAGQFYKGRVYHHRVSSAAGLLAFKGLNFADKAMLSRMAYLLMRYGSQLDFHHPEKGVALDDETVAQFVKRDLSQNLLNYVAGPLISTLFFYSSEETSKLLYLNLAKYMRHIHMFTIRGGIQRLAEELARAIIVETERRVESIAHQDGAFVINSRRFSHVILAIPGNTVLHISGMTDLLEPEDRSFFENCLYGRAVTAFVDTTFTDNCYALSIPRVEKLRAATVIFHRFIDPVRTGVTVIGGGEAVTAQELLDDFGRIYPMARGATMAAEWKTAMPKFPPGRFREVAAFLSRTRRPGLFFCGDYLMGPFIEASITTGMHAADALAKPER